MQSPNVRIVAGCIPLRFPLQHHEIHGAAEREEGRRRGVQCLLVTSRRHKDTLVFPKGGYEPSRDKDLSACAQRETFEEAGVEGDVLVDEGDELVFSSVDEREAGAKRQEYHWFELRVRTEHRHWPEQGSRQRIWVFVGGLL